MRKPVKVTSHIIEPMSPLDHLAHNVHVVSLEHEGKGKLLFFYKPFASGYELITEPTPDYIRLLQSELDFSTTAYSFYHPALLSRIAEDNEHYTLELATAFIVNAFTSASATKYVHHLLHIIKVNGAALINLGLGMGEERVVNAFESVFSDPNQSRDIANYPFFLSVSYSSAYRYTINEQVAVIQYLQERCGNRVTFNQNNSVNNALGEKLGLALIMPVGERCVA